VKTDLFDVELNTLGGDIRRLTMRQVYSAKDRKQPLTLMEADPKHYFVTQSGLLGEGLPTHKTAYEAQQRSYVLRDGQDTLVVRLKARDASGAEVVKRYTFSRFRPMRISSSFATPTRPARRPRRPARSPA
jgi:YidC/Oxa1 family membrane protein insertase